MRSKAALRVYVLLVVHTRETKMRIPNVSWAHDSGDTNLASIEGKV